MKIIAIGLLLGVVGIIWLAERDDEVKRYIKKQLIHIFAHNYQSYLDAQQCSFSFLNATIYLHNVAVKPLHNDEWSWAADTMNITFSVLGLLWRHNVAIDVHVQGVTAHSHHTNCPLGIGMYLKSLIEGDTGYAIQLRSLILENTHLTATYEKILYTTHIAAQAMMMADAVNTTVKLTRGVITNAQAVQATDINLTMRAELAANEHCTGTMCFDGSCQQTECAGMNPLAIQGTLNNNDGVVYITIADKQFSININDISYAPEMITAHLTSTVSLPLLQQIFQDKPEKLLTGTAHFQAKAICGTHCQLDGSIVTDTISYGNQPIGALNTTFCYENNLLCGTNDLSTLADHYYGQWNYDCSNKKLVVQGRTQGNSYTHTVSAMPDPKTAAYLIDYDQNDTHMLHVEYTNKGNVVGTAPYSLLQPLLEKYTGLSLPGTGTLQFSGWWQNSLLTIQGALHNAVIHLPSLYNFVRAGNLLLSLDFTDQSIVIENGTVMLEKGELICKQGVLRFCDLTPHFCYIPLMLNRIFINNGKHVFAVVSGDLDLVHMNENSKVVGTIIFDKAYVKKNIFSTDAQHLLLNTCTPYDCTMLSNNELSLHCITKNPIQVKTSFLKTAATMDIHIKGNLQQPLIAGKLNLMQGQLLFPYKALTITSCHLYIMPDRMHDPLIELVAKGKIRSYQLTMRCQGSLTKPELTFESSPPLTQEQIITLLLAGSSQGSLSLIMPSLIMQHITTIIFGPEQTQSRLERYFKNLLMPLRHIRFVPSFSDQTARGGVRGAIEVEVNDQVRAIIQKNFSLTEDTKLEVEYAITDDITMRGIRDERGDLGGEVEVRWKF